MPFEMEQLSISASPFFIEQCIDEFDYAVEVRRIEHIFFQNKYGLASVVAKQQSTFNLTIIIKSFVFQ